MEVILMSLSNRLLVLALSLSLLVTLAALPGSTAASSARSASGSATHASAPPLTIMTCCCMPSGYTAAWANTTNTCYQTYHYYHTLWAKRFPRLQIKEIDVSDYPTLVAKTLLGVNAGDPPDLIGTQGQLGALVARHAVQNLDAYYKNAHITSSLFLPAMAAWAHMAGHWYAMPENSNPSQPELIYIPAHVRAAGWDPSKIPVTWDQLWTATQKVTRWDSKGNLVRIGLPVGAPSVIQINTFCGSFATYDPATSRFHANSPCIRDYFRYELRLLNFYGGLAKYTKFISGDPTYWSCSSKAYLPTGKIVFMIDAYWGGDQMDQCYDVQWALGPPPTPHGTLAERRAVSVTAQQAEIPTGAKHAQLAFDFVKFTFWDQGAVEAPTGNGFVVASQEDQWFDTLVAREAQIRAQHHYPGNPMATAVTVAKEDARLGRVFLPADVAAPIYDTQMASAWQNIEYGRASVDQALDQAQQIIDSRQRALHAQFGL
jgi:ABC-type glycerol-3-phosphate transport system substrate-binding protein